MTDKEMLERAAKAAGIVFTEIDSHGVWFDAPHKELGKFGVTFNPLTDDGDAFRLAVKLLMRVRFLEHKTEVTAALSSAEIVELHNADPLAATRRAIVRAAAEITRARGNK